MNYWTGKSGDKATGYFGEVTKESLISFQTGYMKLGKKELNDKKGNYVGCGPSTAKSLNNVYKLLNNQFVLHDAKKDIMGQGKREESNAAYNWDIKAGVFNGYVKEAQAMLRNMGYELPEYGMDGKWSIGGETCNALLNFQKSCKDTFDGVNKNGTPESKKQVEHFQGIEPTGKLDQRTYKALEKSINNGETFYGIVVLWAYPKIGRLAKVGEEALVSESAEQATMGTLKSVNVNADVRKFSEYIFKDGAAPGKDVVYKNMGYGVKDSQALSNMYKEQAALKYAKGEYTLGKADSFGQRINIEIELPGIGDAAGKTSYLKSGWMIKPDGSLSLNTPFSGFTK